MADTDKTRNVLPSHNISEWMEDCPPHHIELVILQLAQLSRNQLVDPNLIRSVINPSSIKIDDDCNVTMKDDTNLTATLASVFESNKNDPTARYFLGKLALSREQFPSWKFPFTPIRDRPWPYVSKECRQRIETKLKTNILCKPLQQNTVRKLHTVRCLKSIGWSLMPFAWRVSCSDGRQFKLLKAAKENWPNIENMISTARCLNGLTHFPSVVDIGDDYLLVEYRNGEKADINSPKFSEALGHNLGNLHKIEAGHLTHTQIMVMANGYMSEISHYRPNTQKLLDRVREYLWKNIPDTISTGTVYADLKPENFLFDEQGRLYMLDIGGYQRGQIIDVFLCGSGLFENISLVDFKRAYLATGMSSSIFEDTTYIAVLNATKLAAFFLRVRTRFGVLDRRNRRDYNHWADDKITQLEKLVEAP